MFAKNFIREFIMTNSHLYAGQAVVRAQHSFEVVRVGKMAAIRKWARGEGYNLMDFRSEPHLAFPAGGTEEKIPDHSEN